MGIVKYRIWLVYLILLLAVTRADAQLSVNDTIRLGATVENGQTYAMILLDEFVVTGQFLNIAERKRRDQLRYDISVAYPYALTAAAIFKDINKALDSIDRRHDRKKYLKSLDKSLDAAFKEPLKNLSIDQGHILIKLVDRQTGTNCYHIIKELKGGLTAIMWQGVGVFFNNNLNRDYDPEGTDRELEGFVRDLEASNNYRYQVYQQEALLKKVSKAK
jgi:Domain of unknown function (DUF4294)